jgi:hypothetical protein
MRSPPLASKGRESGPHDVLVGALGDRRHVIERFAVEARLARPGAHSTFDDAFDVRVHPAAIDQLAEHEGRTAGGGEAVHVGGAVRVHACEQRHVLRQLVDIFPVQLDAGGARHREPVDGVVGRAAGGDQRHHGIDDRALVDDAPDRTVVLAQRGHRQRARGRRRGQRVAQGRAGIHEGGAGQLQAHRLEQHLVGIGGAVEGAGAGRW